MPKRGALVPAVPFAFSLLLSAASSGSTVFWQDSGYFLSAVHEMAVLYPHGFALYLVLCKAWTLAAAPLFGFTLAVHLFSSLCAAGAAAFLALAARALLKRTSPDAPADGAAAGAGCLAAAGYSFWHAATLAKPYALFYLCASALLWLLAAAERRRGFVAAGAVLGLAWAAHPSGALLVPAALACAWARRDALRGNFALVAPAAAVCALAPSGLLPLLAARDSAADMADPGTAGALASHLLGLQYTGAAGAFGFDADRWALAGRFAWEEFLGVGLALAAAGGVLLARSHPRLLALAAAWIAPVAGTALLFRGEGQLDQWLVTAWLPLWVFAAVALARLPALPRGAALAAGAAWMIAANHGDVSALGYGEAETYGRLLLRTVDSGATAVMATDDAAATTRYLQLVRGEGKDRTILHGSYLGRPWYDRFVRERYGVRVPDLEAAQAALPGVAPEIVVATAFANENAGPGRPVFTEQRPDPALLRPDLALVPAGLLWKVAARSEAAIDPGDWEFPYAPSPRRARGVRLTRRADGTVVHEPEPYEDRLILGMLHAKARLADAVAGQDPARAAALYAEAIRGHEEIARDPRVRVNRGMALHLLDRPDEARREFEAALAIEPPDEVRTMAHFYLGEGCFERKRPDEARRHYAEALRLGAAPPAVLDRCRARLAGR